MVNTCANPACRKMLRYLRDGIVYLFSSPKTEHSTSPRMEHFWLCGPCAEKWILKPDRKGSVQMIEKSTRRKHLPETETRVMPYAL